MFDQPEKRAQTASAPLRPRTQTDDKPIMNSTMTDLRTTTPLPGQEARATTPNRAMSMTTNSDFRELTPPKAKIRQLQSRSIASVATQATRPSTTGIDRPSTSGLDRPSTSGLDRPSTSGLGDRPSTNGGERLNTSFYNSKYSDKGLRASNAFSAFSDSRKVSFGFDIFERSHYNSLSNALDHHPIQTPTIWENHTQDIVDKPSDPSVSSRLSTVRISSRAGLPILAENKEESMI